jgi:ribosomal protein L7/L12
VGGSPPAGQLGQTVAMGIFGSANDSSGDEGLRRRVEELERRVAALEWAARGAGQAAPPGGAPDEAGVSAEVRQLALQGNKIQAIKVLREQMGVSLREAKDIVEGL